MIHYIPFLKAKRGELNAMSQLAPNVKRRISPFFDFPLKNAPYDSTSYKRAMQGIVAGLVKHWGSDADFYFDDFDIAQTLQVDRKEPYAHILNALKNLQVVPVVGLGRGAHNDSVVELRRAGEIASSIVAFRAAQEDFEDFDLNEDEIGDELSEVFAEFDEIDLILDCRVCITLDVSTTAQQIAAFARKFCQSYNVRRVIITGSSIPASIGDIAKPNTAGTVRRRELAIISKVRELRVDVVAGDYSIVSPFYSEADFDPRLFQKVTAPRLIYSFNHSHYIARGVSLEAGGQAQYGGLTNALCQQPYFRGRGYSMGEDYFDDKRRGVGNNATNGTVVTPSVVAHITYMALDAEI